MLYHGSWREARQRRLYADLRAQNIAQARGLPRTAIDRGGFVCGTCLSLIGTKGNEALLTHLQTQVGRLKGAG